MNYGPLLFLGILFTLAGSWFGLVLMPNRQLGDLQPDVNTNTAAIYPRPIPGEAAQGKVCLVGEFGAAHGIQIALYRPADEDRGNARQDARDRDGDNGFNQGKAGGAMGLAADHGNEFGT